MRHLSKYGIEIRTPQGQIIIDSEHPVPKLYEHGIVTLANRETDLLGRQVAYGIFSITPTTRPVFATYAINENKNPNAKMRYLYTIRASNGYYTGIYVAGAPESLNAEIYVWVYTL